MKFFLVLIAVFGCISSVYSQPPVRKDPEPGAIIDKAVAKLGGDAYLNVRSVSSSGKLSVTQESKIVSFQSFVDVIVYPDKERTDFNERGAKTIQVNVGDKGWIFEDLFDRFGDQTERQLEGFRKSLLTHYDYLLRGRWKGNAELKYAGQRRAGIGVRNDVLRLDWEDGFWVEYEFSKDGLPKKTVYPSKNPEGEPLTEENHYAQFILTEGILFPYIIDHFTNGKRTFRVNYVEVKFNRRINDSIFQKPANPKKIKKLKI